MVVPEVILLTVSLKPNHRNLCRYLSMSLRLLICLINSSLYRGLQYSGKYILPQSVFTSLTWWTSNRVTFNSLYIPHLSYLNIQRINAKVKPFLDLFAIFFSITDFHLVGTRDEISLFGVPPSAKSKSLSYIEQIVCANLRKFGEKVK